MPRVKFRPSRNFFDLVAQYTFSNRLDSVLPVSRVPVFLLLALLFEFIQMSLPRDVYYIVQIPSVTLENRRITSLCISDE